MLSLNPFYKCIKASKYLQSSLSFDLRLTRHCPQWMLLFNSEHLFKLIICCMWSSRLVFPIQFSLYSCTGEVRSNWAESWNSLSRFTCLPPRTRVSQSVTCFESPLRKKKKWLDDTGKWQVPFKIRCNKSAIHQAARYLPFFRCTDHIFSYHPDSISYCQSRWADFSPVSPSTCCGMAPSLRHCSVGAVVAGAADGADVSVNARHVCRDAAFLHPPTHCLLRHTACLLLSDALRLPAKVNCCWLLLRGNIGLHILTERLKQAHSDMSQER